VHRSLFKITATSANRNHQKRKAPKGTVKQSERLNGSVKEVDRGKNTSFNKWKLCSNEENVIEQIFWQDNQKNSASPEKKKYLKNSLLKAENIKIF